MLIFRLDALALSVIATATWLGGWVGGWVAVTHRYCIKTTKPIRKLFYRLKAPSLFLRPLRRYKIPRGTPSAGALNTRGVGKLAIFVRFSTEVAVYLGNGARWADGYYGTLIGSRGCRIGWYNFR